MALPETTSSRWAATEGLPFPLGLTRIEEEGAYNFALYSKHVESVTLLLYTESDLSFDSRSLAFTLHGTSQQDLDLYVMINAYGEELTFQIQEGAANAWRRVVDTSLESPFDFLEPGNESALPSLHYRVPGRAVVVLVRDKDGTPQE